MAAMPINTTESMKTDSGDFKYEENVNVKIKAVETKIASLQEQIYQAEDAIEELDDELLYLQQVANLRCGKIDRVSPKTSQYLKRYSIYKVRVWPANGNQDIMFIIDLQKEEIIKYNRYGSKKQAFKWSKDWVDYKIQKI